MPTVVESIKAALARRDGISEESMRPLVAAYATEVERVNDRLSSSVALLRKGLRSEAIQSVSMSPNAIDDAAALDFMEAEEWFDILQFLGIPLPSPLERDLAEQLNEAIVETQPLEGLLKQQRRLAIARAPLAWRLKILRTIAELDPANGVWQDDLESWEKVRCQQLNEEAAAAIATGDLPTLERLEKELTRSPWIVQPEASTIKSVQRKLKELADKNRLAKLGELAPVMHDAYCQLNEPTARRLRDEWNSVKQKLGVGIPDDLSDQAEGMLQWLAQLDHQTEQRALRGVAIGRLEAALDRGGNLEDLEKAHRQATTFDEPPPPELLQRYQITVADRELAKKRRFQIIVTGIAMVAVIAIVATGLWQWETVRTARTNAAINELQGLVESQQIESATAFLADLRERDPKAAAAPGIMSLAGQLDSVIAQERERADKFRSYLDAATAEDPSQIDLAALSRAESVAVSESEKAEAFQLRNRWSKWDSEVKSDQTTALLQAVKLHQARLDQVEKQGGGDSGLATLDAMLPELEELAADFPKANASARLQVNAVRTRAISMRNALKGRIDRERIAATVLNRLFGARTLSEYQRGMERFVNDAPASSLANEFKAAFDEQETWDKGTIWNDFIRAAIHAMNDGMSSSAMQAYETEKQRLTNNIGVSLVDLPPSVTERFSRYADRHEILDRVLGELTDTVIADLFTMVESDGQRRRWFLYKVYYEQESEKLQSQVPNGLTVDVVANDAGAVEGKRIKANIDVWREPFATIQMLASLSDAKRGDFLLDWEGEFLRLSADLRSREGLDGQIKEMLLQHLLAGASEGSQWLAESLKRELLLLKNRRAALPGWHTTLPFDDSFATDVEQQVIPRLAELYRQRPQPSEALKLLQRSQLSWVGFLRRSVDADLEVHLEKAADDGVLAVPRPSRTVSELVDWVEIGSVRDSQPTLHGNVNELIAGLPVFYLPKVTTP